MNREKHHVNGSGAAFGVGSVVVLFANRWKEQSRISSVGRNNGGGDDGDGDGDDDDDCSSFVAPYSSKCLIVRGKERSLSSNKSTANCETSRPTVK